MRDKILEAAKNDDWQALKQLFESANPEVANIDPELMAEWWQWGWPQYNAADYRKDEVAEYIREGQWDADQLRRDIAEAKEKTEAASFAANYAISSIKESKSFADLASWFASAFDVGPAGSFPGLADAVQNLDAIFALAKSLKVWRAVYDDQAADIDDRIDAQNDINKAANSYNVALPGGGTVTVKTFEKITGMELLPVKPLMSGNAYADMKLTQYRDEAQNVCARAGVAPMAAIRRIKDANDEITQATQELNDKTAPLCREYQTRLDKALESTGYNAKKLEAAAIAGRAQMQMDDLGPRPSSYDSYATVEENRVLYARYQEWSDKVQAVHDERDAAFKVLQAEMAKLHKEATAQAGDWNAMLAPFNDAYNALVAQKREEIVAARAEIGRIKEHVIASSPVSKEAADQWFDDMVLVPKNMQANLKKRGYTPEKLKADMTEFYRLTGGRLSRVSFETKGGQRAAAQKTTGVVYVAGEFSRTTFFHELAHLLEDDERTSALAHRFLDQRTGREQDRKVYTLASLTGNRAYRSNETAYKDSFIDPYVGKYYSHGSTEVFSMGMQYFASPEAMAVLAEKDPDHFAFMLGYAATTPRVDKSKVEQQQQAMAAQKDTVQTSEDFLKALDKRIAKAGDFWSKEGISLGAYKSYRGGMRYWAEIPIGEGRLQTTPYLKSEKNVKRALWLWMENGRPTDGPYALARLSYDVFGSKTPIIPKEMAKAFLEAQA